MQPGCPFGMSGFQTVFAGVQVTGTMGHIVQVESSGQTFDPHGEKLTFILQRAAVQPDALATNQCLGAHAVKVQLR